MLKTRGGVQAADKQRTGWVDVLEVLDLVRRRAADGIGAAQFPKGKRAGEEHGGIRGRGRSRGVSGRKRPRREKEGLGISRMRGRRRWGTTRRRSCKASDEGASRPRKEILYRLVFPFVNFSLFGSTDGAVFVRGRTDGAR